MTAKRAVFLDRDGVINKAIIKNGKPYPPANVAETVIVPDAKSCLSSLGRQGFLLLVVTNQPDVARGTAARKDVEAIHDFLRAELPLDNFFTCFHDDKDRCDLENRCLASSYRLPPSTTWICSVVTWSEIDGAT